jgi:hypothetical protein
VKALHCKEAGRLSGRTRRDLIVKIGGELKAEHESNPPDFSKEWRFQCAELLKRIGANIASVRKHRFVFDDREHLIRAGTNERCTAEGSPVCSRSENVAERLRLSVAHLYWPIADPDRAKRKAAGDSLSPMRLRLA